MIRGIAFGSAAGVAGAAAATAATPPTDQQDKEICIREVINSAGRAREVRLDCKVGKMAKKTPTSRSTAIRFSQKVHLLQRAGNGSKHVAGKSKEVHRTCPIY